LPPKELAELILVTGGAGYIGSHTIVELLKAGFNVVAIDNFSNSEKFIPKVVEKVAGRPYEFIEADLQDKETLDLIFKKIPGIKTVIHFAASKSVAESVVHPLKYYENNIAGMINLLGAMQVHKVKNLVFSSSCTVYGQPRVLPVTESSPILPAESPYGRTKQICEDIISDLMKSWENLSAITLRYFNPIGAHESAMIGELPRGVPNNLVPYITQTAYGLHSELKIFGNDYETPDGTCIRDYIHVTDLAIAHVAAAHRLSEGKCKNNGPEIFNIGTGTGVSVFEAVQTFRKATGVDLKFQFAPRRPGDVEKIWANPELANQKLGWKSEKSLSDALLSAWNWEKYYREQIQPAAAQLD
jgi:UDP-glucose 4-epimerase